MVTANSPRFGVYRSSVYPRAFSLRRRESATGEFQFERIIAGVLVQAESRESEDVAGMSAPKSRRNAVSFDSDGPETLGVLGRLRSIAFSDSKRAHTTSSEYSSEWPSMA